MEVKTYTARNIQEALLQIRGDLGPQAAILHTRELRSGALWNLLPGMRRIEVTAALDVPVPSRLPPRAVLTSPELESPPVPRPVRTTELPHVRIADTEMPAMSKTAEPPRDVLAFSPSDRDAGGLELDTASREMFHHEVAGQLSALQMMVEELYRRAQEPEERSEIPESVFQAYTRLLDVEVDEELARELVEDLHRQTSPDEQSDPMLLVARLKRLLATDMLIGGGIRLKPGECRIVALVGPTGVGKTTTLAKLAAHYRLREKRQVGLITVDTYRIAAVEQLRTYAEIIDLPMEVVSTTRDMRAAVERMAHLDLILIDTAGRSPSDELKIQELKSFLVEAGTHEVHLVLSSVASASTLERAAKQFAPCGVNGLTLTKLDEAGGLGNILPLLRGSRFPLRYLTDGQNVPDDIEAADATQLVNRIFENDN
ncbi:MAG: flagellar biosynthesis protein FlhF [Pirellulales bacterium]